MANFGLSVEYLRWNQLIIKLNCHRWRDLEKMKRLMEIILVKVKRGRGPQSAKNHELSLIIDAEIKNSM